MGRRTFREMYSGSLEDVRAADALKIVAQPEEGEVFGLGFEHHVEIDVPREPRKSAKVQGST